MSEPRQPRYVRETFYDLPPGAATGCPTFEDDDIAAEPSDHNLGDPDSDEER